MKPIPAIDENREFVEATLVGGATVIVLCFEGEVIRALEPPGYMWQLVPGSFKDWPAVRERVERARGERERIAREDAKRLEAFGVEDRTAAGVKVTYSPSGAASVDSRELFEKVIEPLLAESQRRQAIRAHAGVDEPRRPSFAEALERTVATEISRVDRNPNRAVTPAILYDWLMCARAASVE